MLNATNSDAIAVDAVIFGGGVSGLWTLDVLHRAGYRCVLLESAALGAGQTVGSQGIIHGGLKYTLAGALTRSAEAIRDMPGVWRDALAGKPGQPDASATTMRSEFCHLWRTGSLGSRLGMVGARVGLRVKPQRLPRERWPAVLRGVGGVFQLDEQVVSPPSFVESLAALHPDALVRYDAESLRVNRDESGTVDALSCASGSTRLRFRPAAVVLTAGLGNATLRELAGIQEPRMQRRGVHMILLREADPGNGAVADLNGHCVDGNKTRVTVTSDVDTHGRRVWQVGGQVSEDGTDMPSEDLLRHALREVKASLGDAPQLGTDAVQWATYRLDKAEVTTAGGLRPDDAFVEQHGNVVTCWPTKLALAPRLAERVLALMPKPGAESDGVPPPDLVSCERPVVASPPWETCDRWTPGNLIACDDARSAIPTCS